MTIKGLAVEAFLDTSAGIYGTLSRLQQEKNEPVALLGGRCHAAKVDRGYILLSYETGLFDSIRQAISDPETGELNDAEALEFGLFHLKKPLAFLEENPGIAQEISQRVIGIEQCDGESPMIRIEAGAYMIFEDPVQLLGLGEGLAPDAIRLCAEAREFCGVKRVEAVDPGGLHPIKPNAQFTPRLSAPSCA